MNKSETNSITITDALKSRIDEAESFFNRIFGNVTEKRYGYLWAKRGDEKITYPFDVSSPENRHNMAVKAIELSDAGFDVYYGVNLMDTPPAANARVKAEFVTLQTATVTDIDCEGGTHINTDKKKYPPFDVAKSFLPFPPSIIIHSGYGLHGLNFYSEPIPITADNRKNAEERNKKYLEVIRNRAGQFAKAVDSVGDLPRVLRVPGTYNYKLGRDNAPLCHVVEVNDMRFTHESMDNLLNDAYKPAHSPTKPSTPARNKEQSNQEMQLIYESNNSHEFDIWRALKMLDVIPVANLSRDDWVNVGMALKNNGNSVSDWEDWSRPDDRFKLGECEKLWQGFNRDGFNIGTICDIANRYGYDPKAVWKEWCDLHPEFKNQIIHRPAQASDDNATPMDDQQTFTSRLDYLSSLSQSSDRDNQIIAQIRELCDWKTNRKGERLYILPTFNSLRLIFDYDPNLKKLVGYDEFQGADVLLRKPPWKRADSTNTEWTDKDDAQLRLYLREYYAELQGKQIIEDMTTKISQANSFNAVKNFFAKLPEWDGQPRAETLFIEFLRVDDTPYAREVTLNWLLGAVARIFHPGCRYQTALVLHGNQKIGKSYIIECLGRMWYIELTDNVDDSHASDAIKKGWIVEIKEMAAMRKAEINAVKAFIERSSETRRAAYDRRATTTYRHCVFAITVNDSEFLRDVTGNRRYMILHCNSKMFDYVPGLTDDVIKQVWAEVFHKYNQMFDNDKAFDEKKLALSKNTEIKAEEIATHFMQDDGMTNEIKGFLDKKIPPQFIWQELTREERRKFFENGFIKLVNGKDDLIKRRQARGGKSVDVDADVKKISNWLGHAGTNFVRKQDIKRGNDTIGEEVFIYGSEFREHVCAPEIFNECFGSDKRKAMYRITDILETMPGWTKGKRLQKSDTVYRDQKRPYYRNTENHPVDETDTPAQIDDFHGEPIDPDDVPF